MPASTGYYIKGDAPPGLAGSADIEARVIDKPGNVATRTVFNDGPDSLTVQPVTITGGGGFVNATYTGAGSTITAGQNVGITVLSPAGDDRGWHPFADAVLEPAQRATKLGGRHAQRQPGLGCRRAQRGRPAVVFIPA